MTMTLEVTKRDVAAGRSALPAGHIPAVVYGPQQESIAISTDEFIFDRTRKEAGEATIINLNGLEEELEVLIKHIDFDPAKQEIVHVDFYAIERGKDMTVTVPLEFVGEAPAEKVGSVTKAMQEIEVTCRPKNLPAHITVDVSVLEDEHSKITVADLPALEGVTYNAELEDAVAVVSLAKEEEETEAAEAGAEEGAAPAPAAEAAPAE